MKKIISFGVVLGAVAPMLAFAVDGQSGTFGYIINLIGTWVGMIVPILIALAIAYFIWGVISFITSSDEEAKKKGRTKIINGLIGLFVIMAFWGVIALVKDTFGIQGGTNTGNDIIWP